MRTYTFTATTWVPRPLDEVFAFFGDAQNLDRITPPWLHFRTLTPAPLVMQAGTHIDYRLRLRRIPLRWRSAITVWEPPHRFVDEQLRGPYKLWIHEHTFHEENGGTRLHDHITYAVPGGWLAPLVQSWLVGPDIARIFTYRQQTIETIFAPQK